jgi:radical SAM protein with 4Fe4S-binding SPASM domain
LIPCYAGRLNLVLTESGDLYPCEGRWDRSFGNVREAGYDLRGMLRSERAERILDEIARGGCYCSHECNFLTNILYNPMMHPRLLRDYVRLRMQATAHRGRRWST